MIAGNCLEIGKGYSNGKDDGTTFRGTDGGNAVTGGSNRLEESLPRGGGRST